MQKDVEAVLCPVLLELRVGDELGHDGGDVWEEEEGGGGQKSDETTGVTGQQMRVALYGHL